jgi:hypothetical protein
VDLVLRRVQAYRVFDNQTVVTVSQLFPVANVEEFPVSPSASSSKPSRSGAAPPRRRAPCCGWSPPAQSLTAHH